jgi:hypothetical protein
VAHVQDATLQVYISPGEPECFALAQAESQRDSEQGLQVVLAGELVRIQRQILEETSPDGWFRRRFRQPQADATYPYVVPDLEQAG